MANQTSSPCDVCSGDIGLGQASFTSECAHTFHLPCVSGAATCPVCAAKWSDTPATAPARLPASPFSFAPPAPPTASPFVQTPPLMPRPSSLFAGAPPPRNGGSLSGQKSPPATQKQNPFWLSNAPPTPSCSACHGAIDRGQATVTSECNHTFHLGCISGNVCPACSAQWRDEVTVTPSQPRPRPFPLPSKVTIIPLPNGYVLPSPPPPSSFLSLRPSMQQSSSPSPVSAFNDDEPVEPSPLDGWEVVQEATNDGAHGALVLTTHCEHPAVARDAAREKFAVLVHAKAPAAAAEASERAPLDLVTVLDVSGSMEGSKLVLLKQAMGFVIDHLGSGDRLSVVTFSSRAHRIIRLTRMTDGGKALAKGAVESLFANGATNIGDGLRVAAEVLDGRRQRNAVASVILLSDGQDNYHSPGHFGRPKSYTDLVPRSMRRGDGDRSMTVHTFGFGVDHDAAAMHAIAEATGGTFSFIQDHAVVQDSFAQCIGGLLSVAVQEARIAVECLDPGVRVRAVKSGRYVNRVDADGRAASVDVGELYADEERRFLLLVDVPVAAGDGAEDGGGVTRLIKASCTYRDAATRQTVDVSCEDAVVRRPVVVAAADTTPSVEVARERFRVEAAEDIAAARAAAERGAHAEAARILDRRQEASAAAGLAGDARCAALVAELRELSARVADRREYEQTGRACLLAGMSSHAQQRASTVQLFATAAPAVYGRYGGAPPPGAAAPPAAFGTGASSSSPFRIGAPRSRMAAPPTCGAAAPSATRFGGFGPQQGSAFGFPSSPNPFEEPPNGMPAPTFGAAYATPAMQGMVESSKKRREQRQPR
ncbi:unnamed protein product [Urochloa decumbens]|uniref:Uncharacterized protein n=1 Tax=Urochloa decumbens TaxID=240449 RepID=A0ABC8Z4M3_9POAL